MSGRLHGARSYRFSPRGINQASVTFLWTHQSVQAGETRKAIVKKMLLVCQNSSTAGKIIFRASAFDELINLAEKIEHYSLRAYGKITQQKQHKRPFEHEYKVAIQILTCKELYKLYKKMPVFVSIGL